MQRGGGTQPSSLARLGAMLVAKGSLPLSMLKVGWGGSGGMIFKPGELLL